MDLLMNKTVNEFNNLLGSKEPAPGGGSVAALSGVMGTALTMMVVNLSVGKKSYEALEQNIKDSIMTDFDLVQILNKELTELVDEDTKAFNLYMEALKMPKETDSEISLRNERIKQASVYTLKIPMLVCEKCLQALQHQKNIAKYGNKNAVSDIGVGALMAYAGIEGAALNVKINLPSIEDQVLKIHALNKIDGYLAEGYKLKTDIINLVNDRIDN